MNRSRKKAICLSIFVVLALLVSLAGCGSPGDASSGGENSSAPENSVSASASTSPVENTADPSVGGDEVPSQAPESSEAESGDPIVPSGNETENTIPITVTIGDTVYAATLENSETVQMQAIETTVRHVDGRVPVIVGTGSNSVENAYAAAKEPKELYTVADAEHIDLYDRRDRIPFDKLAEFFSSNLK